LSTTTVQSEFWHAMDEASRAKDQRAAPIVLRRMDLFPRIRNEIIEDLYRLDSPAAVPQAREWVKQPLDLYEGPYMQRGIDAYANNSCRFWAAMILLRHGDRSREEGLNEIAESLAHDRQLFWTGQAIDQLAALDTPRAREIMCNSFRKGGVSLEGSDVGGPLRRLIRARCHEAYEFLVNSLQDTTETSSTVQDRSSPSGSRKVSRADLAARIVADWRTPLTPFPFTAPADVRAAQRAQLHTWLIEQFQLLETGRASKL
jgi:hypothetical protein